MKFMEFIETTLTIISSVIVSVFTSYHALRERILRVEIYTDSLRENQDELQKRLKESEEKIDNKLEIIMKLIHEINLKLERNKLS